MIAIGHISNIIYITELQNKPKAAYTVEIHAASEVSNSAMADSTQHKTVFQTKKKNIFTRKRKSFPFFFTSLKSSMSAIYTSNQRWVDNYWHVAQWF